MFGKLQVSSLQLQEFAYRDVPCVTRRIKHDSMQGAVCSLTRARNEPVTMVQNLLWLLWIGVEVNYFHWWLFCFCLESDLSVVRIRNEQNTRKKPENIRKRHQYKYIGIAYYQACFWMQIFSNAIMNVEIYRKDISHLYVELFRVAIAPSFCTNDGLSGEWWHLADGERK